MTENNAADFESAKGGGISRRTVTKAMAWAVPVVAVAAPAPAFAASGNPPVITVGNAYKWPGASCNNLLPPGSGFADPTKAYVLTIQVANNSGKTIFLYDATVTVDAGGPAFDIFAMNPPAGTPIPGVAPGNVVTILLFANSDSSANLDFTGTVCVEWGHNFPGPDPENHPPVCVDFDVPCTPTPTAAGFQQCEFPLTGGHNCQTA